MTDEQILLLVESEGFDILSPDFSCIYNDRLVFGINNTERQAEPSLVILTENESIEIVRPEKDTKAEDMLTTEENAGEFLPQEIVLNTPIEYNIPENSFISEGEEELDILAQWEAFLEEEASKEKSEVIENEAPRAEEVTPISTELTESAETTQITIKEEPKTDMLSTEETPLAALFKREKPILPEFKQILVQGTPQEVVFEPISEKTTVQLAAEKNTGGFLVLLIIGLLALGAGIIFARRHYAKKDRKQTKSKY